MNIRNVSFSIIGLLMVFTFAQSAERIMQIKDLGIDGESRIYDVICPSGNGTLLYHRIGHSDVIPENEVDQEQELIELVAPKDDAPALGKKPEVCTLKNDGEYDCKKYKNIDSAAEAVCKEIG